MMPTANTANSGSPDESAQTKAMVATNGWSPSSLTTTALKHRATKRRENEPRAALTIQFAHS